MTFGGIRINTLEVKFLDCVATNYCESICRGSLSRNSGPTSPSEVLHSAKGGAVETGCSDSYVVIHYLTM